MPGCGAPPFVRCIQDVLSADLQKEGAQARLPSSNGDSEGKPNEAREGGMTVIEAREGGMTVIDASDKLGQATGTEMAQDMNIKSSVQSWVDSLPPDTDYECELSSSCSGKCAVGCEKHCLLRSRSALHRHFGYKSPLDLLGRIIFSEDEDIRIRTESDSTESSSSSSNTARQSSEVVISSGSHSPLTPGSSEGVCELDRNSTKCEGKDARGPLLRLLKKSWKKRHSFTGSLKAKVVVNGYVLSSAAVKQAEEQAGKLSPGLYWYDCKAGFWGVEGGPCRGILPPLIKQFSRPMVRDCADGNTQVYVNGRELNSKDLAVLSQRGLPKMADKAYSLDIDGVLVDETTGLEVKHLGKLAPTVKRRGKGFGMFAGNIPEITKASVQCKFVKERQ